MRRVRIVLAIGFVFGLVSVAMARNGMESTNGFVAESGIHIEALGVRCDGSMDATARLRAALEVGGRAAGRAVRLPSGCKVLLGTPGAGDSVADVASDTTIDCANSSAGFVLARHYCSGGATPGAACDGTGTDCPGGGSCVYDTGSSEFAPTSGQTYTVFGAPSGSSGQQIRNCGIWTNQRSADLAVMGGDDQPYGYCSGGTLGTAACLSTCSVASGLGGLLCNADADCGGGTGACQNRNHCATGGGTCRPWLSTQPGGASGAGNIHPIDWSNASGFSIEGVTVYDLRTATTVINLGTNGHVSDLNTAGFSLPTNALAALSMPVNPAPVGGLDARPDTLVEHSTISGWRYAARLRGGTAGGTRGPTLRDSILGSFGNASESTWPGTVGVYFRGAGASALYNRISGYIGGMCETGGTCNFPFFMGNDTDFVTGPMWQVQGSHNNVQHNRKAWGGRGAMIAFGEFRGRCPSGSRSGLVCLQGAGVDSVAGCPSSSCAAHADFPGEDGGHCQILNNFLHSDDADFLGYVAIDQSKRCSAGSAGVGAPCSTNGDCGTGGACSGLAWPTCQINNNELYNVVGGGVAFNLDSPALSTAGGGGISGWSLVGNLATMNSGGTGFKFPSSSSMGSANLVEANLITGATTDFLQWDSAFGRLSLPVSSDLDATAGSLTLSSSGTDITVATLPDYDNTYRRTVLNAAVDVTAAGGTRNFTINLKLEGTTVASRTVSSVASGVTVPVSLTYVDTTSAAARSAVVTVQVSAGNTSTATNRVLTRMTSSGT